MMYAIAMPTEVDPKIRRATQISGFASVRHRSIVMIPEDLVAHESGWSSSDQIDREISMFKFRILFRKLPRVIPRIRAD